MPARILIVEDNEMNRDMLSRRLQRRGFDICIALDGLQGLEAARTLMPDLILMDMSLPQMDGWSEIPIVVLTAMALSPEDRERLDGQVFKILQKGGTELAQLSVELDNAVRSSSRPRHAAAATAALDQPIPVC